MNNPMRDGYILEKAIGAMRDLAWLAQELKENNGDYAHLREVAEAAIYQALWDITKIASTAANVEWKVTDRENILASPDEQLEQLLLRYGWISETHKQREERRFNEFVSQIRPILADPQRAPSRTLLHDLRFSSTLCG